MSASLTLGLDAARALDPARFTIGGRVPRAALRPTTREEIAEALRAATRDGLAVVPWGGGAGLARDAAPARYDLALDLGALDRVVEYEPGDYTLTAECGATIASLRATLAARGQELPLEAPHAERATLGGVLAANASGARRLRLGAPRDRVLGARFALGDGTLARTGGKVVKNVAGFGIHRLLCGSRGGLAIVLEASLKLATVPAARAALVYGADARALADAARWAALPRLEPAALTVAGRAHEAALPAAARTGRPLTVVLGFEEEPARVAELVAIATKELGAPHARLDGADAASLWQALADAGADAGGAGFVTAANTPAAIAGLAGTGAAERLVFHAAGGRLHLGETRDAAAVAALAAAGFRPVGGATDALFAGSGAAQAVLDLRTRIRTALDPAKTMAYGDRWERGEA